MGNFCFYGPLTRSRSFKAMKRGSTICHAVDKTKFRYSPEGTKDSSGNDLSVEARLVVDFQDYFKGVSGIDTKDKVMAVVQNSKDAAEWYKEWSSMNSIATSLPAWLDKTKIDDLKAWKKVEANKLSFDAKQAAWAKQVEQKASELKALVQQIAKDKDNAIDGLDHFVLINMVNQNHLSTEKASVLAQIKDKAARKAKAKDLVTELQKELRSKDKSVVIKLLKTD